MVLARANLGHAQILSHKHKIKIGQNMWAAKDKGGEPLKLNLTFENTRSISQCGNHIFTRNVHACNPSDLMFLSVLVLLCLLCKRLNNISRNVSSFLEKLCKSLKTIFCRRCHLFPVLHICRKCSCHRSVSPRFLSRKLDPMAMQEKHIWTDQEMFWKYENKKQEGVSWWISSSQRLSSSKPINTGPGSTQNL